jgi:hypothetical protein
MAYKKLSVKAVQDAKNVSDLGRETPCLSLYVDTGPEFGDHSAHHLRRFPQLMERDAFKKAEEIRRAAKILYVNFPSAVARRLAIGGTHIKMRSQFSHFFVCNVAYLPTLLADIKKAVIRSARSISAAPPPYEVSTVPAPAG